MNPEKLTFLLNVMMNGSPETRQNNLLSILKSGSIDDSEIVRSMLNFATISKETSIARFKFEVVNFIQWSNEGHENLSSFRQRFFKNIQAILALFCVSSRDSFMFIENAVNLIISNNQRQEIIMLVGLDDGKKREVSFDEAQEKANSLGLIFIEVDFFKKEELERMLLILGNEVVKGSLYS